MYCNEEKKGLFRFVLHVSVYLQLSIFASLSDKIHKVGSIGVNPNK